MKLLLDANLSPEVPRLFDPSGKVVRRAIFGFTELPLQIDATRAAFAERLRELFNRGDREVRAAPRSR